MGQYESKARHRLERIRYYHENGGPKGYAQAKYHYNELARLQMAAQYSKKIRVMLVLLLSFESKPSRLCKK
jgi:hypothetical protein